MVHRAGLPRDGRHRYDSSQLWVFYSTKLEYQDHGKFITRPVGDCFTALVLAFFLLVRFSPSIPPCSNSPTSRLSPLQYSRVLRSWILHTLGGSSAQTRPTWTNGRLFIRRLSRVESFLRRASRIRKPLRGIWKAPSSSQSPYIDVHFLPSAKQKNPILYLWSQRSMPLWCLPPKLKFPNLRLVHRHHHISSQYLLKVLLAQYIALQSSEDQIVWFLSSLETMPKRTKLFALLQIHQFWDCLGQKPPLVFKQENPLLKRCNSILLRSDGWGRWPR